MELVSLFYLVDEFCKGFEPKWQAHLLGSGTVQRIMSGSQYNQHTVSRN